MSEALLQAVRGLRVSDPGLGFKPLLAKLREEQPDLGAGSREVREALTALKAESEATAAAAAPLAAEEGALPAADEGLPPAADEGVPPAAKEGGAPPNAALSLACIGCGRLPSDMDDEREKHPICDMCRDEKLPTTYLCGEDCPANPDAWELHGVFHKKLRKQCKMREDGGASQQRAREQAERETRYAAQTGDAYDGLLAEGLRYASKDDWRRAGKAYREAIALKPDKPTAYYNLGEALNNSGHSFEAAQWYLGAKERYPVGSEIWAKATAHAFNSLRHDVLRHDVCNEVAKPEWWNDEGLKALSARVVRAAPNQEIALNMRAGVLSAPSVDSWGAGPRSPAELKEAAAHFERSAALSEPPAIKAARASSAVWCRNQARQLIKDSVLLKLDAQIEEALEEANVKQAQLIKLLDEVNDEADGEAISSASRADALQARVNALDALCKAHDASGKALDALVEARGRLTNVNAAE
eukprot:scaffold73021_cov61-Phaeocystis_antarctica.AAC.3